MTRKPALRCARVQRDDVLTYQIERKGDSYDNALAETINGLYQAELIHRSTISALLFQAWPT